MISIYVTDDGAVSVTATPKVATAPQGEAFSPAVPGEASAEGVLDRFRPLQRFREHLIERAVAAGGDRAKVEAVVSGFGDGTLLKLILDNLDNIIAAILKLIGAFG